MRMRRSDTRTPSLAATPLETAGAVLAGLVGVIALAGLATGALGIWPRDPTARPAATGEMRGACITLDMAEAHGILDDRQRRMILRALASAGTSHAQHFTGGLRGLQDTCSEIARGRWSPVRGAAAHP